MNWHISISRGFTCSKRNYRLFLQRVRDEEFGNGDWDENGVDAGVSVRSSSDGDTFFTSCSGSNSDSTVGNDNGNKSTNVPTFRAPAQLSIGMEDNSNRNVACFNQFNSKSQFNSQFKI